MPKTTFVQGDQRIALVNVDQVHHVFADLYREGVDGRRLTIEPGARLEIALTPGLVRIVSSDQVDVVEEVRA